MDKCIECNLPNVYLLEKDSEPIITLDNILFTVKTYITFEIANNIRSTFEKATGKKIVELDAEKEVEKEIALFGKEKITIKEFLSLLPSDAKEFFLTSWSYWANQFNIPKEVIENNEYPVIDLREIITDTIKGQSSNKKLLNRITMIISNNVTLVMRNYFGELNFSEIDTNISNHIEKILSLSNKQTTKYDVTIKDFKIVKLGSPRDITEELKKLSNKN